MNTWRPRNRLKGDKVCAHGCSGLSLFYCGLSVLSTLNLSEDLDVLDSVLALLPKFAIQISAFSTAKRIGPYELSNKQSLLPVVGTESSFISVRASVIPTFNSKS